MARRQDRGDRRCRHLTTLRRGKRLPGLLSGPEPLRGLLQTRQNDGTNEPSVVQCMLVLNTPVTRGRGYPHQHLSTFVVYRMHAVTEHVNCCLCADWKDARVWCFFPTIPRFLSTGPELNGQVLHGHHRETILLQPSLSTRITLTCT